MFDWPRVVSPAATSQSVIDIGLETAVPGRMAFAASAKILSPHSSRKQREVGRESRFYVAASARVPVAR